MCVLHLIIMINVFLKVFHLVELIETFLLVPTLLISIGPCVDKILISQGQKIKILEYLLKMGHFGMFLGSIKSK